MNIAPTGPLLWVKLIQTPLHYPNCTNSTKRVLNSPYLSSLAIYKLHGVPLSKTALWTDFPLDTEEVLSFKKLPSACATLYCVIQWKTSGPVDYWEGGFGKQDVNFKSLILIMEFMEKTWKSALYRSKSRTLPQFLHYLGREETKANTISKQVLLSPLWWG